MYSFDRYYSVVPEKGKEMNNSDAYDGKIEDSYDLCLLFIIFHGGYETVTKFRLICSPSILGDISSFKMVVSVQRCIRIKQCQPVETASCIQT